MLRVSERITIPLDELSFDYARSGGPGGQNVNKVASKATLRWRPAASAALTPDVRARLLAAVAARLTIDGELLITSQRTRDQGRNVADCLEKLRLLVLAAATPPKPRRPTRPTLASKIRRGTAKSQRAELKHLRRRVEPD
jgi:ribosome-associated protein